MDAKVSPSNADLVAWVCNGDLWVSNLRSGEECKLTDVGHEKWKTAGCACYIEQEEFDRFV